MVGIQISKHQEQERQFFEFFRLLLCETVFDVLRQLAGPGVRIHEGGVCLHQKAVQGDHVVL